MKRTLRSLLVSAVLIALFATVSCKKKKAFKREDGQAAVEVRNAQAEEGVALMDINRALAWQAQIRGNRTQSGIPAIFNAPCGLSVDTTKASQGILILGYDGSTCNGRTREGSITLTLQDYPAHTFRSAGCRVKVDFDDYKVSREAFNTSFGIDGTLWLTNENGGSWYELVFLNQPLLTEAVTAEDIHLSVNGVSVLYTISRRISYTWADSTMSCVEEGTGTVEDKTGIDSWGYTRAKEHFYSQVTVPVKWTSACGPVYPTAGEVSVKEDNKVFGLKSVYHVDESGNAADGNGCAFGFKTTWTYKGSTVSRVFGYEN